MPLALLVDGYNVLHSRPELFPGADLQESREELLSLLAGYKKKKGLSITVVFDAAGAPGRDGRRATEKGMPVVYSRLDQSADSAIRELCGKMKEKALVVTSDRALARDAEALGASTVGSDTFLDRVMAALYGEPGPEEEETPDRRDKKGPAKREKKARRKQDRRLTKL